KSPSAASLVIFRIGVDRGHVFRLARRTGISSLNQAPVVLDIQENKTWLAALRDGHRMAEGLGDDISGFAGQVARRIAVARHDPPPAFRNAINYSIPAYSISGLPQVPSHDNGIGAAGESIAVVVRTATHLAEAEAPVERDRSGVVFVHLKEQRLDPLRMQHTQHRVEEHAPDAAAAEGAGNGDGENLGLTSRAPGKYESARLCLREPLLDGN